MKILLTILLVVIGFGLNAQVWVNRSTPAITAIDARLKASMNLIIPVLADTLLLNQYDSLGCILQVRSTGAVYIRDTNLISGGHKWSRFLKQGDVVATTWGTITGTLTAQTDLYDSLLARFRQNGNSFGDTARLGTNDNFPLSIELNNQRIFTFTGTPIPSLPSSLGVGGLWVPGGGISLTGVNPSPNNFRIGETLTFSYGSTAVGAAQNRLVTGGGSDAQYTSSEGSHIYAAQNFLPTSGNAIFNYLKLDGNIIQSGGANGITRGLHVAINHTGAVDFRAIQTDSGNVLLNALQGSTAIGLPTNNPLAKLHVVGSGLFTDTLTATTMSDGDSSNRVATTAWVKRQDFSSGATNGLSMLNNDIVLGQDSAQSGNPAALLSTREVPLNGNRLYWSGEGDWVIGSGNTGIYNRGAGVPRFAINDSGWRRPLFAVGRHIFAGDGITSPDRRALATVHMKDTLNTTSLSQRVARGLDVRNYHYISDNSLNFNLNPQGASNFAILAENRWLAKDTFSVESPGGDLMGAIAGRQYFMQYPGFTGKTTFRPYTTFGGTMNNALSAMVVTNQLNNNGGSNSVRINGVISTFMPILIATNGRDTVDDYSPYHSGALFASASAKIKRMSGYRAWMASFASITDTLYGFYQDRFTGLAVPIRNYFGNTTIIGDTIVTPNILQKSIDTTNYKVKVVDASGNEFKMYWPSSSASTSQMIRDSTGYYTVTGTTTDATPTNIAVIPVSIGYVISIEATCIAITADGDDAFSGVKYRAYHKTSGGTLTSLTLTTIAPDAYVGGGLSTATFTLTNSGTDIAVQVTGEVATTINWKIRYRMLTNNVSF